MGSAAKASPLKIGKPGKIEPQDQVTMRGDHAMDGDVGDDCQMMVHGKIEGVHHDEFGRRVEVKIHKITPHKGGSK